jgi:hypothetical protein
MNPRKNVFLWREALKTVLEDPDVLRLAAFGQRCSLCSGAALQQLGALVDAFLSGHDAPIFQKDHGYLGQLRQILELAPMADNECRGIGLLYDFYIWLASIRTE